CFPWQAFHLPRAVFDPHIHCGVARLHDLPRTTQTQQGLATAGPFFMPRHGVWRGFPHARKVASMSYYLAPSLVKLRDLINQNWPNRDKSSDGWIGDPSHQARKSDHNPDYSAGGVVRAIDVDE